MTGDASVRLAGRYLVPAARRRFPPPTAGHVKREGTAYRLVPPAPGGTTLRG
ncbi:hypothetical protein EDD93_1856 [Streptomyces sp. 840.1]|nr:hypothetical protein EDD93_1856 [Streptomyces sp. 840.1]